MNRAFVTGLATAAVLTALAAAEVQVNERTSGSQANPAVAVDPGGGAMAVWSSYYTAPGRGFIENGRGQALAQLAGVGVVLALGLVVGWLVLAILSAPWRRWKRERRSRKLSRGSKQPTSRDVAEEGGEPA